MDRALVPAVVMRSPLAGLAWVAVLTQFVLFGAPLLLVSWLSLQGPPEAPAIVTPSAWLSVLGSPEARRAMINSMALAAMSAVLTTILAVPLAYLIAVRGRLLGRIALAFVIVMWFFDPGMRILGWMQAFKDLALLNFMPLSLLGGFAAELVASVHAWLPAAILCLAIGFARIDPQLVGAARECGATAFVLLRRIFWPLNRRLAALTAAIVFCGSLGNFLEPRLLGSGDYEQATEWLQRALESETGWPYAAVMVLLMLFIAILPLALILAVKRTRPRVVI